MTDSYKRLLRIAGDPADHRRDWLRGFLAGIPLSAKARALKTLLDEKAHTTGSQTMAAKAGMMLPMEPLSCAECQSIYRELLEASRAAAERGPGQEIAALSFDRVA